MNFKDLVGICIKNLLRRRTRTILAVVGVVVGTCAIVVMLSIGFGLTESYSKQIESYGNLHMISLYGSGGGYSMSNSTQQQGVLTDKTIASIGKMEGVDAITPMVSSYMTIGVGKYITSAEIRGINPEVMEKFNYSLEEGRMLKAGDKDKLLFGNGVAQWFYNPKSKNYQSAKVDVITNKMILTSDWYYGQKDSNRPNDAIDYEIYDVEGVGLLSPTNDESEYSVYMNITRLEEIIKDTRKAEGQKISPQMGEKTYERALVYVADLDMVEKVNNELKDLGYQTYSPIDWISQVKETANMIQMILGGIGGISLIVAALGITNTMIMSIYERTREIGVMKVIGANLKDIRRMFLMEAGMIGFIGGAVGIVFSLIVSLLMNTVLYDIISFALNSFGGGYGARLSVIPIWLVGAAILFSTGIGLMAGYSPASRAMKLSALESLKNE